MGEIHSHPHSHEEPAHSDSHHDAEYETLHAGHDHAPGEPCNEEDELHHHECGHTDHNDCTAECGHSCSGADKHAHGVFHDHHEHDHSHEHGPGCHCKDCSEADIHASETFSKNGLGESNSSEIVTKPENSQTSSSADSLAYKAFTTGNAAMGSSGDSSRETASSVASGISDHTKEKVANTLQKSSSSLHIATATPRRKPSQNKYEAPPKANPQHREQPKERPQPTAKPPAANHEITATPANNSPREHLVLVEGVLPTPSSPLTPDKAPKPAPLAPDIIAELPRLSEVPEQPLSAPHPVIEPVIETPPKPAPLQEKIVRAAAVNTLPMPVSEVARENPMTAPDASTHATPEVSHESIVLVDAAPIPSEAPHDTLTLDHSDFRDQPTIDTNASLKSTPSPEYFETPSFQEGPNSEVFAVKEPADNFELSPVAFVPSPPAVASKSSGENFLLADNDQRSEAIANSSFSENELIHDTWTPDQIQSETILNDGLAFELSSAPDAEPSLHERHEAFFDSFFAIAPPQADEPAYFKPLPNGEVTQPKEAIGLLDQDKPTGEPPEVNRILTHLRLLARRGGSYPAARQLAEQLAIQLDLPAAQVSKLLELQPDGSPSPATEKVIEQILHGQVALKVTPKQKLSWLAKLRNVLHRRWQVFWRTLNHHFPIDAFLRS